MWEAIQSNKRRSWLLVAAMCAVMTGLGYVIGAAIYVEIGGTYDDARLIRGYYRLAHRSDRLDEYAAEFADAGLLQRYVNSGGLAGSAAALGLCGIMTLVAFGAGDRILLRSAGAVGVREKADHPQLWNVVEEMTIAAGLPKMPDIFVVEDEAPNAFAVGRSSRRAAVAVTSGLLKRLGRDELQGVIAHEIAHIHNLDVRYLTLAAVMVGAVALISEVYLRGIRHMGSGRRASRGGGKAAAVLIVVALIAAILAPIVARLLYFACSRRREYLADACAAQFTRYPEGLASALEKIGRSAGISGLETGRILAPMFIVSPLQGRELVGWFSTHPPLEARIRILRSMAGGAGLADYEAAFRRVHGDRARCLGERSLMSAPKLAARAPRPEEKMRDEMARRAALAVGVLDRAAGFVTLLCSCGARLKVPPNYGKPAVRCPRCQAVRVIPAAGEPAAAAVDADQMPTYQRQGTGWESFRCRCGGAVQLSPTFSAERVSCRHCGRHIRVVYPPTPVQR